MNRVDTCFAKLKGERAAFIPYITAGDPTPEHTVELLRSLAKSGADIIEIGMPFSDPMADGPVIQAACERALRAGANLHHVLAAVTEFRQQNSITPIVLMGYMNPLERFGCEAFCKAAAIAGVDALLLVDLPPEESVQFNARLRELGLHQIFLVAPTTSDRRLMHLATMASGFIYHVALKGITGASHLNITGASKQLERIRAVSTLPIAVGFGVRCAADVSALGPVADAVVVGSALVEAIAGSPPGQAVETAANFVAELTRPLRPVEEFHS